MKRYLAILLVTTPICDSVMTIKSFHEMGVEVAVGVILDHFVGESHFLEKRIAVFLSVIISSLHCLCNNSQIAANIMQRFTNACVQHVNFKNSLVAKRNKNDRLRVY